MSSGSGPGPYSRQYSRQRLGKGKSKGWICSEACMESMTTAASSQNADPVNLLSLAAPPLHSDLRPAWVLEVKEWLRENLTLAEFDVLFN